VRGWVRHRRGSKGVFFVHLNDGSTIQNIQVVVNEENTNENVLNQISVGACLQINGNLVASQGAGQSSEVQATEVTILGAADPNGYPIQPKKHSMEFLRENAHLRMRTNTFSAVFRIRHAAAYAIHKYYNDRGFYYLHTPIITGSDAEGAGEMFQVTTLPLGNPPLDDQGEIDFKQDFFGQATNLSVSGQLQGELGAMGLGLIYTFGPTFRAENSNTTRHLAEFWMIEPEMAFYEQEDNHNLAEDFLKYLIRYVLEHCKDDLKFLDERFVKENNSKPTNERSDMGLIEKLEFVIANDFARVSYTEAINILLNSKPHKKKKFKFPVEWGIDMQSEHERYLVEKHFKKPVIVYDYPREIKAFYMKQNEGEEEGRETVRAMDILVPGIGEIIGGSQREDNLDRLMQRMDEVGIPHEELDWYLDIRRFGSAPHSGFGLGFERFILFVTGMANIRDVIPFPRTPGNARF
ncbi:MAG TPA: asparagine--tRNA ligase, partial [Microscillaceae bacterium]|nr:asparagine--tRNA ligase [Microscillaceae bacterium]